MDNKQKRLIEEEQGILNDLIDRMNDVLTKLNKEFLYHQLKKKKASGACLPEAYGMLIQAEHDQKSTNDSIVNITYGRNELYQTRVEVKYENADGDVEYQDMKIGLHTYMYLGDIFIFSWKERVCRKWILDDCETTDIVKTPDRFGRIYTTYYELQLKRKIELFFDEVREVVQLYPLLTSDSEKIIADEFLQELLNRRTEKEFINIVFSIQKRQGEIIQAPLEKNIIVQGCAGSGKSMIMLHRLPIILFDNKELDRKRLYIITPSRSYIQMANNMRSDLEIADLNMGTLQQYYEFCIEKKYGYNLEKYKKNRLCMKVNESEMQYAYSSDFKIEVKKEIEQMIKMRDIDYQYGCNLLKEKMEKVKVITYKNVIRSKILTCQKLLKKNEEILNEYCKAIGVLIEKMYALQNTLGNYKNNTSRIITSKILEKGKQITKLNDKIKKDDKHRNNSEQGRTNNLNYLHRIEEERRVLLKVKENIENDDSYFSKLMDIYVYVKQEIKEYDNCNKYNYSLMSISMEEKYEGIRLIDELKATCYSILDTLSECAMPYQEWNNDIVKSVNNVYLAVADLEKNKTNYLPQKYQEQLRCVEKNYVELEKNIVDILYESQMQKLYQASDKEKKIVLDCSPYMYLQILYLYAGAPNAKNETLITIDEAQNMAFEEIKLIEKINNDKVILNLFGDVKQHIENSKGIDSWDDLNSILKYDMYDMRENYRNARQITEYCNRKFKLNMNAINLDGSGVHELLDAVQFDMKLIEIVRSPMNSGISSIIVKNIDEAKTIMDILAEYQLKINNMVDEANNLDISKWNLMTVEQSKGLEFKTVFAISGRMSQNEKYISYTRALDELYVYDDELKLRLKHKDVCDGVIEKVTPTTERKKRKKRARIN